MNENKTARLTVRVPTELLPKLQDSADENSRSVAAELVHRIKESFAREESDLLEITPWVPHAGQLVRTPLGAAVIQEFSEPNPGRVCATVWSAGHGPRTYGLELLRPYYTVNYAIRGERQTAGEGKDGRKD